MGKTDHKESSKSVFCRSGKCCRGTGIRIKGWEAGRGGVLFLCGGEGRPSGKMTFEWRPERNKL